MRRHTALSCVSRRLSSALLLGLISLVLATGAGFAATDYAYSGRVVYTFVGGAGNAEIQVSWRGGKYLVRSTRGEFLFADFEARHRIYVCAPTLNKLKTGAWPNDGSALKICAQYRVTGNNFGLIEADNELAHYFSAKKTYLPKGVLIAPRTYAGAKSSCYTGGDPRQKTRDNTICLAQRGGYTTFMDIPNARWTATEVGHVDPMQLALPYGAKVLSLARSALIIP